MSPGGVVVALRLAPRGVHADDDRRRLQEVDDGLRCRLVLTGAVLELWRSPRRRSRSCTASTRASRPPPRRPSRRRRTRCPLRVVPSGESTAGADSSSAVDSSPVSVVLSTGASSAATVDSASPTFDSSSASRDSRRSIARSSSGASTGSCRRRAVAVGERVRHLPGGRRDVAGGLQFGLQFRDALLAVLDLRLQFRDAVALLFLPVGDVAEVLHQRPADGLQVRRSKSSRPGVAPASNVRLRLNWTRRTISSLQSVWMNASPSPGRRRRRRTRCRRFARRPSCRSPR